MCWPLMLSGFHSHSGVFLSFKRKCPLNGNKKKEYDQVERETFKRDMTIILKGAHCADSEKFHTKIQRGLTGEGTDTLLLNVDKPPWTG